MEALNILVVEDDDTAFNGYSDESVELSTDNLKIILSRSKSAEEAIQRLSKDVFQGAIIDLNLLGETHPNDASGNKVASEIHKKFRIPIIIVSGNIDNFEPDFNITEDNQFIKTFERSASNKEIFQEIINIFQTGILKIIGGTGLIEEKLNTIFWNHLSKDIDAWFNTENTEHTLLRYTLNHLSAHLNTSKNDLTVFHKAEFYLKPPIKETIASGDILCCPKNDERFILLSPACDVELRSNADKEEKTINAKSLILGKVHNSDPDSLLSNGLIKKKNKRDTKSFVSKLVKGQDPKYVFLPCYKEINEGIINFQNLKVIDFIAYKELNRIATVSESFFKDIQSKFSSYYARQGSPDLNKEQIIEEYINKNFPSD